MLLMKAWGGCWLLLCGLCLFWVSAAVGSAIVVAVSSLSVHSSACAVEVGSDCASDLSSCMCISEMAGMSAGSAAAAMIVRSVTGTLIVRSAV